MLNLQQQLVNNQTVENFLDMIVAGSRDLGGKRNYVLVTKDALKSIPGSIQDIIEDCKNQGLIEVEPSGSKCFELHITPKGLGHLKKLHLRRGVPIPT